MTLFKHTYSGLITGGLGGNACCGLITMGFHVFKCTIEVFTPPTAGGGGGSYVVEPGIYVPWPKKITKKTRMVQITVKYREQHTWRRSYILQGIKASIIIRIVDVVNTASSKLNVGINKLRLAKKRVTAVFRSDNK